MMSDVFNTAFEISLRILLTLEAAKGARLSADLIAAADFIAVYAKDFGIADNSLHGENGFKFGEFALQRELTQEAVKSLVLDGMLYVESGKDGFGYYLSERGIQSAVKLTSGYAEKYRDMARRAHTYLQGKSERGVLRQINNRSVLNVHRGEANG